MHILHSRLHSWNGPSIGMTCFWEAGRRRHRWNTYYHPTQVLFANLVRLENHKSGYAMCKSADQSNEKIRRSRRRKYHASERRQPSRPSSMRKILCVTNLTPQHLTSSPFEKLDSGGRAGMTNETFHIFNREKDGTNPPKLLCCSDRKFSIK